MLQNNKTNSSPSKQFPLDSQVWKLKEQFVNDELLLNEESEFGYKTDLHINQETNSMVVNNFSMRSLSIKSISQIELKLVYKQQLIDAANSQHWGIQNCGFTKKYMINQLNQHYTSDQIERFSLIFLYHDKEMTGFVNQEDLPFMLRSSGLLISDKEIRELHINQKINKEDYFKLLIKLKDKQPNKKDIQTSIKVFDQNETGIVDTKELMGIVQQMGDDNLQKEFQKMLTQLKNKDNQVTIESLINLLIKE